MSEKIITANRNLICDLCGRGIPQGEKCRMIRDDSQTSLVYFEHLRCSFNHAVVTPLPTSIRTNKTAVTII